MSTDLSIFIHSCLNKDRFKEKCAVFSVDIQLVCTPLFGDETNGGSHEGTRTFSTVDPKAH